VRLRILCQRNHVVRPKTRRQNRRERSEDRPLDRIDETIEIWTRHLGDEPAEFGLEVVPAKAADDVEAIRRIRRIEADRARPLL
jgi:hypothetical protein